MHLLYNAKFTAMKKLMTTLIFIALAIIGAKAQTGELLVTITDVKPDGTFLLIGVGDYKKAPESMQGSQVLADSSTVVCHLKNLTAGEQKVYVFQDQNGNYQLDFSSDGKPLEGVGRSENNSWEPSVIIDGTLQKINIRMVYLTQ